MKLFKKEKQEQKITYRVRSEEELKIYKQEREQEREQNKKIKQQLLKKFELHYKIDKDIIIIDGFEQYVEGIIRSDGNYPQLYAVYKEYIENVYLPYSTYMKDISTIKNIPVENIHIKKINLLDFVKIEGDDLFFGILVEIE